MVTWDQFIIFAVVAMLFWIAGAWAAWKNKRLVAQSTTVCGLLVFFAYIVMMWVALERPPLRTMGETRLWYSAFLPLAGIIIYSRWHYRWVLSFSTVMSLVFICINLFKPEIHSKTLMPALQSPWFAPHVIVYMFAYALFGAAVLIVLAPQKKKDTLQPPSSDRWRHLRISQRDKLEICDNLIYVALAFLTIGMLFGALWAKEAWGHYWAWDPKETWAAVTWFTYLAYIHLRRIPRIPHRYSFALIIIGFIILQICWWGINYMPSAQGMSVHTYSVN